MTLIQKTLATIAVLALLATGALATNNSTTTGNKAPDRDWPQWGRDGSRNMAGEATGIPSTFDPGEIGSDGQVDIEETENVLWVAKLGSQTYGNPTIVDGRIYIGTNNHGRGDKRFKGDHSLLKCLDAKTGETHWTLTIPKLGSGKVGDWELLGICSSPSVIDDRVYVMTNRCEVLALDVHGLKNGNQGDQDEAQYMAMRGIQPLPPVELKETDADIIWRYDMRTELGVYPHNVTSSSTLVVGDIIFAATSNGVTYDHRGIPAPKAPALIALDRKHAEEPGATPETILVGEEGSGLSKQILHCNWTSPCYGEVDGKGVVIFGGPDGRVYGFDPNPVKDEDGFGVLPMLWKYDVNLPGYRFENGDKNKPIKYATAEGPSEIISTPVFHDGLVYVAIGQDPEHGEGVGNFACVNAKNGEHVWSYPINRSISTASIADGLAYVADYSGWLYCFDAKTGKLWWKFDTVSPIWGSTLVADGKVFLGNEDGMLTVFETGPTKAIAEELGGGVEIEYRRKKLTFTGENGSEKVLKGKEASKLFHEIEFGSAIYLSPVVADGVLYTGTMTHLYAVGRPGAGSDADAR